jgi:hypothetical protein
MVSCGRVALGLPVPERGLATHGPRHKRRVANPPQDAILPY